MATNEREGSSGSMKLFYRFSETSSGHEENSRKITLVGNDDKVSLVIEDSSLKLFKGINKESKDIWEIPVSNLITLIKENGTKV